MDSPAQRAHRDEMRRRDWKRATWNKRRAAERRRALAAAEQRELDLIRTEQSRLKAEAAERRARRQA
jgi:hypothetical protein